MKELPVVLGAALLITVAPSFLRAETGPPKSTTAAEPRKATATATPPQNPAPKAFVPQPPAGKPDREPLNPIVEHLRASMILDYATYLVVAITAIFAIFLGALGIFEWRRVETLKREVVEERKELRQERQELHEERRAIYSLIETAKAELLAQEKHFRTEVADERKASEARIDRIEALKPELEAHEKRLHANQRFLDAVLSHHSNLLVGIVKGFGSALQPEEVRNLKSLISEAESALDLFRPSRAAVMSALLRLEQIGSHGSVSSLAELRDDPTQDADIRIRAQTVLIKVKERLRNEHAL